MVQTAEHESPHPLTSVSKQFGEIHPLTSWLLGLNTRNMQSPTLILFPSIIPPGLSAGHGNTFQQQVLQLNSHIGHFPQSQMFHVRVLEILYKKIFAFRTPKHSTSDRRRSGRGKNKLEATMKATSKCQKMQFFQWNLEPGLKNHVYILVY